MFGVLSILAKVGAKSVSQIAGQILSVVVTKKVLMRIMLIFIDKVVKSSKTNTDNSVWALIRPELVRQIDAE